MGPASYCPSRGTYPTVLPEEPSLWAAHARDQRRQLGNVASDHCRVQLARGIWVSSPRREDTEQKWGGFQFGAKYLLTKNARGLDLVGGSGMQRIQVSLQTRDAAIA